MSAFVATGAHSEADYRAWSSAGGAAGDPSTKPPFAMGGHGGRSSTMFPPTSAGLPLAKNWGTEDGWASLAPLPLHPGCP